MKNQRESNWNDRYLSSNTPWEDSKPHPELEKVFAKYCKKT